MDTSVIWGFRAAAADLLPGHAHFGHASLAVLLEGAQSHSSGSHQEGLCRKDTSTKCGSKPISAVLLMEWSMCPFFVSGFWFQDAEAKLARGLPHPTDVSGHGLIVFYTIGRILATISKNVTLNLVSWAFPMRTIFSEIEN